MVQDEATVGEALKSEWSGENTAEGLVSTPLAVRDATQAASPATTTTPSQALSDLSQDRIRGLEDKILRQSLETVEDALKWAEIDAKTQEPPQAWVEELGLERAKQRLRVAKAAHLNAKEAPVGLGMARTTATGILKIRAAVKIGAPQLGVVLVQFPAPAMPLEVIDVGGDSNG